MNVVVGYVIALIAVGGGCFLLWRAVHLPCAGWGIATAGVAGIAGIITATMIPTQPMVVTAAAYGVGVIATFAWLLWRHRGKPLDQAIDLSYGSRLTVFERGFFAVVGAGMVTVFLIGPETGWAEIAGVILGVCMIVMGISGRPPAWLVSPQASDVSGHDDPNG